MSKCKIAITADTYPFASDVTNLINAPFAPRGLTDIINKLGALPLVLADVNPFNPEDYVELCDALIIPGGPDVDPKYFGEEPHWKLGRTNYKRDEFEMALFKAFYKAGKPIFGICRGHQLINIAMGGTVYQDLPSEDKNCYIRHSQAAPGGYPTHYVNIAKDSELRNTLGEKAHVNSRHHQGVKVVGEGLKIVATAPDGVIEALESSASDQIQTVQWHPENMWQEQPEMEKLFADFIARVQAYKNK